MLESGKLDQSNSLMLVSYVLPLDTLANRDAQLKCFNALTWVCSKVKSARQGVFITAQFSIGDPGILTRIQLPILQHTFHLAKVARLWRESP